MTFFAPFGGFRRAGPYRPLHIALSGPPYVESSLPTDLPILNDEVKLLESQVLDLLSYINEADNDD